MTLEEFPHCKCTHKGWDCNNLTGDKRCIALTTPPVEHCPFYRSVFSTAWDDLVRYHNRQTPELFDYDKDHEKEEV